MRLGGVLALAGVTLALFESRASASPQARLVYGRADGADACPDESALRRAVAARVGYDPFFPSAPRTVIVTIAARGDHLAARVQLVDDEAHAQGARELESSGRDCATLFDTVALTISIAIDPQALARPSAPAAPSPPPKEPEQPRPAPPPAAPFSIFASSDPHETPDAPSTPSSAQPGLRLGAALRTTLGLAPAPAMGLSLDGGAVWKRASLSVEGSVDLPASQAVGSSERVSGSLLTGALVPCLRFAPAELCALAVLGRFEGSATGVSSPQARSTLFGAFGARVGIELPIAERFSFHARADALVNAGRVTLRVGSSDEWTASAVAGVLSVGVARTF